MIVPLFVIAMKRNNLFLIAGIFLGLLFLSSCKKNENLPPEPGYFCRPIEGNTETIFTFDASETVDDKDSLNLLKFRWDWESDGVWDTDWRSDPIATHRFLKSGTYQIDLQVMDVDGEISLSFEFLAVDEFFLSDPRDDKQYKTVRIGDQMWMAENLQYDVMVQSWCYHDSIENCAKYGRLYSWGSAQSACPPGWILPDKEDWDKLLTYVGSDPGNKLRSTTGWNNNMNGTDNYGFNAKPASFRHEYGDYSSTNSYAYFWSADSYSVELGWTYLLFYNRSDIERNYLNMLNGFSVRCLRF